MYASQLAPVRKGPATPGALLLLLLYEIEHLAPSRGSAAIAFGVATAKKRTKGVSGGRAD